MTWDFNHGEKMKNDLRNYIEFTLYPALIDRQAQGEIFGNPEALNKRGKDYFALCPFHNENTPSFTMAVNQAVYHCFGCGAGGDWIDFMQKRYNLDFIQALEKLAGIAGAPRFEGSPAQAAEYEKRKTTADILTTAQAFFIECLKTDEKTRAYLDRRGYTQADIDAAGLGAFPGAQATIDYLKGRGFAETDIKTALKWIDWRADYRLVIPYRDTWGRMIGIMGRLTRPLKEGEKEEDKYKPVSDMEGIKAANLFNFDQARGQENLLLAEGLLDAAILTARGIPAAALGGAEFLDGQLDQAIKHGTKFFILALDNDAAGKAVTEKAILKIWRAGRRAYVVTLPDGIKDPDELIKAQGIDAFKTALAEKEIAPRWIPGRIINSLPDGGNIYQIVEAIRPYARTAGPVEYSELLDGFAFMYPRETLEKELNRDREKAQNEKLKAEYRRTINGAQDLLNSGDIEGLQEFLTSQTRALGAKPSQKVKPFYWMDEYLNDEKHEPGGLKTGYKELDNYLLIPSGALTVIAARVKHGKTILMLNLMMNQLKDQLNKGKTFFYFSYEQPKKQLMRRLLIMGSGHVIDNNLNYIKFGNYLKYGGDHHVKIEDAKTLLRGYIQGERLGLIDYPFYIDELTGELADLAARYRIGAVYIDYIQLIKIKGRQARYEQLQAIAAQLRETAISLKIPIIVGCQANRNVTSENLLTTETMRESGDIESEANIILGLWDRTRDNNGDQKRGTLAVKILENRDGGKPDDGEAIELFFDKPILKITDK